MAPWAAELMVGTYVYYCLSAVVGQDARSRIWYPLLDGLSVVSWSRPEARVSSLD